MVNGFYATPDALDDVADDLLQQIVGHAEDSRKRIADTAADDAGAFRGHGEGVMPGELSEWANSRDLLVEVLKDNIENLKLAQQALREIARRYRDDDASAASGMNTSTGGQLP